MENIIGKKAIISGMLIEIISDDDESWECRNSTTGETVFIKKSVLKDAVKLGKAEVISDPAIKN